MPTQMVALDTPSGGNWTAWINGQAYHTPAEAYTVATNAVLNTHLPEGAPQGKITTVIKSTRTYFDEG